jgi:hypothetical protein
LLFALVTPALVSASSQAPRKPAGKKARRQPVEAPRPPLPQELPPVAPTVTFRGGQLTIVAHNSTLFDILTAVRKATGAVVDAPAASAGERVATRLGPGRPREVLSALLDGSPFDYILLGSSQDPGGVRRLILTSRSGSGAAADSGSTSPSGVMFSRPAQPPVPTDSSEDEDVSPGQSVEPAEEVPPEPQTAPPPEVKSPEQLQQELRQQEEQQRQQQQQQQQQQQPQQEQPPPQ